MNFIRFKIVYNAKGYKSHPHTNNWKKSSQFHNEVKHLKSTIYIKTYKKKYALNKIQRFFFSFLNYLQRSFFFCHREKRINKTSGMWWQLRMV